ncbi:MAG TPA: DUF2202 domain-containing protein [Gammaproteobacteria bacterium]|nr:DUF2202 domain-containing protein [Gammaproteobacteria bacterium]
MRRSTLLVLVAALGACSSGSGGGPTPRSGLADVTSVTPDGSTSISGGALEAQLLTLPLGTLTDVEAAGIAFMREEEKLAYDVYVALGGQWGLDVFVNLAASEQTHADAVLALIARYGLTDPVGSNPAGVFAAPVLQGLYDTLSARGSSSLIDALIVGAEIEEIDIVDIDARLADVTGNADIELVYENLKKGSRNHLRAFVRNLENQNFTYQPQHLTQAAFDAIIASPTEPGAI